MLPRNNCKVNEAHKIDAQEGLISHNGPGACDILFNIHKVEQVSITAHLILILIDVVLLCGKETAFCQGGDNHDNEEKLSRLDGVLAHYQVEEDSQAFN